MPCALRAVVFSVMPCALRPARWLLYYV